MTVQTFEDLTSDQQDKLTALLAELKTFPLAETIVRCQEAIGDDPTNEADRKRIDAAMAGAWAYQRVLLYLQRLRSLNKERMQIGKRIRQLLQHPDPTTEEEVEAAARARVLAPLLAGEQEVVVNFLCVSIKHIRSLLQVTAEAVEYEIPHDDLEFLDKFRHLRNHFEHWYERLPGKDNEIGLITKTVSASGYHVRGGLETDDQDRIFVVVPKKPIPIVYLVEANVEGIARVERIVMETSDKVRALALERVRAHYVADPNDIPSPDSIGQELLFSVGGYRANR